MAPPRAFCPHLACAARGQTGHGNRGIHSRKAPRCSGTACPKTFTAPQGTAGYRLRTAAELVRLVVPRLAPGWPWHAGGVAVADDERTVACGLARAGVPGPAVPPPLGAPPAPAATCKPMRYASKHRAASWGWRWP